MLQLRLTRLTMLLRFVDANGVNFDSLSEDEQEMDDPLSPQHTQQGAIRDSRFGDSSRTTKVNSKDPSLAVSVHWRGAPTLEALTSATLHGLGGAVDYMVHIV